MVFCMTGFRLYGPVEIAQDKFLKTGKSGDPVFDWIKEYVPFTGWLDYKAYADIQLQLMVGVPALVSANNVSALKEIFSDKNMARFGTDTGLLPRGANVPDSAYLSNVDYMYAQDHTFAPRSPSSALDLASKAVRTGSRFGGGKMGALGWGMAYATGTVLGYNIFNPLLQHIVGGDGGSDIDNQYALNEMFRMSIEQIMDITGASREAVIEFKERIANLIGEGLGGLDVPTDFESIPVDGSDELDPVGQALGVQRAEEDIAYREAMEEAFPMDGEEGKTFADIWRAFNAYMPERFFFDNTYDSSGLEDYGNELYYGYTGESYDNEELDFEGGETRMAYGYRRNYGGNSYGRSGYGRSNYGRNRTSGRYLYSKFPKFGYRRSRFGNYFVKKKFY